MWPIIPIAPLPIPYDKPMRDIAYADRSARKSPSLALAAVLTLAVGANTAVFTVLEALVVNRPEQLALVTIASVRGAGCSPEALRTE